MSIEQMNRLGLLQQDPPVPVTHNLDVSIPSPSASPSASSPGYPSPTPSLPASLPAVPQFIQLQGTTILLQPLVDNSTLNLYPQQPVSVQAHRTIAPRKQSTTPWRPW